MRASWYVRKRRSRVAHTTCSLPLITRPAGPHLLTHGGQGGRDVPGFPGVSGKKGTPAVMGGSLPLESVIAFASA